MQPRTQWFGPGGRAQDADRDLGEREVGIPIDVGLDVLVVRQAFSDAIETVAGEEEGTQPAGRIEAEQAVPVVRDGTAHRCHDDLGELVARRRMERLVIER